jgi:hypothetical protein
VVRQASAERRSEPLVPPQADPAVISGIVAGLASSLLDAPGSVRALHVRLTRLALPTRQAPLFPPLAGAAGGRTGLL